LVHKRLSALFALLIIMTVLAMGVMLCPPQAFSATQPLISRSPDHQLACEVDLAIRRARYDLQATLDWNTKILQVEQTVHYRNDSDSPLNELVFQSEPHRLSRANTMTFRNAIAEDGSFVAGTTIDGWRMTVPLPQPAPPGCDAVIKLQFDINVTALSDSNPLGWLAYTERQLNLGHWFPTIGLYGYEAPGQWYTPQRHYIGEQTVPEIADYTATLRVNNAPGGLQVVAPGQVARNGNVWNIILPEARDLAISMSTHFQQETAVAGLVTVELYHFAETRPESVAQALKDAQQAVSLYSERFGAYPRDRLVVVEGDFADGYEFSGLVFVSEEWFEIWNNTPQHWLNVITIHEIAHQWWYAWVANNQGTDAYLDEALATYSELLYYEHYQPDLVQSWWDWRVFRYDLGDAPVDSTVYEYTQWRPYINAVYFRGAMMLRDIRAELGDDVFFQWLRDYAQNNTDAIALPATFWGALSEEDYLALQQIRQQYLRNSNVLAN
jgi:hypothetical protein